MLVANLNNPVNPILSFGALLLRQRCVATLLSFLILGFNLGNISDTSMAPKNNRSCSKMKGSRDISSKVVTSKEATHRSATVTSRSLRSCKELQVPTIRRGTTPCGPSPRSHQYILKQGQVISAAGRPQRCSKLRRPHCP